jgi:hypothetical protein
MFDPSEYMKPFRKYADIDVGGLVFPDPSEIRFGEKGYAGEVAQFFKTNVTNVWGDAMDTVLKLRFLEDLSAIGLNVIQLIETNLIAPVLEAIDSVIKQVPFANAVYAAGKGFVDALIKVGKEHAKLLDQQRIYRRWYAERKAFVDAGASGPALFTLTKMPRFKAYGPTGIKLSTSDLYRKIGAYWGTSPNTVVEFTPIFYPWFSTAQHLEPVPIAPNCVKGPGGGGPDKVCFASGPNAELKLSEPPKYFDRNGEMAAIQASLLQDPAANLSIPTSLIQRLTRVLDDIKPGTAKGRLNADSFDITPEKIQTAKRGMAVFLQAREGFLADPNACLRAASSGTRLDPALKAVIKENANQGLKDIAGGLGSGGIPMVTISLDALKAAAEALEAQQKSESSGGAAILLLGAAAAAAGIYAVTRKR